MNIRIGSDLHRMLAEQAQAVDVTINAFIKEILEQYIKSGLTDIKNFCVKPVNKHHAKG